MNDLKVNIMKEDLFILLEDVEIKALGYSIRVKRGFDFDGASLPRSTWSIIGNPLTGDYKIAALIHDALYASEELPRDISDNIFLEIMRLHGVGYIKRYAMYNAVRSFGWYVWSKHEKEETVKYKGFISVKNNNK